ncbi:MAG: type I-E CRISPR-associated protein Cas6/Cse3/CasE [Nitrospirota bacterium]
MYFSQVRIRPNIQQSPHLSRLIQGNTYGIHQLLWDLFPGQKERSFLYREEIAREQLGVKVGVKGEPIYYIVSEERPTANSPLFEINSKLYAPKLQAEEQLAFKLRANPVITRKREGRKNSMRHDVIIDSQRSLLLELSSMLGLSGVGKKSDLKDNVLQAMNLSDNQLVRDKLQNVINKNERFKNILPRKYELNVLMDLALKSVVDKSLEDWLVNKGNKIGFELVRDEKRDRRKFQAESYRWHSLPIKGKTAGFSSVDFEGQLRITGPDVFTKMLFGGIGPAKAFGCGLMMVRRV